jgi:glycosyltransferase involved in cell wall biosynthesis
MVSIIITAYNQASTIIQSLDSILAQECNFPFEIIIGDDCSTDETRTIGLYYQNKYPEIIRILTHKKNMGVAGNFVTCCKQANGKYIALCAADDYWHNPQKLQLQVDYLESHTECGLLYTDYDIKNAFTSKIKQNVIKKSGKITYTGNGLIQKIFSGRVPVLTVTVMFRKKLFDNYIPAEDYIKYRFPLEDWPTWLIFSKYTSFDYLPISTATYRIGHESISNPKSYERIENRFASEQLMYKYLCNMFPDDLYYNEVGYQNYINSILLNLAYKKFDYISAKKFASKIREISLLNYKTKLASNRLTFYSFALMKKIKQMFIN